MPFADLLERPPSCRCGRVTGERGLLLLQTGLTGATSRGLCEETRYIQGASNPYRVDAEGHVRWRNPFLNEGNGAVVGTVTLFGQATCSEGDMADMEV